MVMFACISAAHLQAFHNQKDTKTEGYYLVNVAKRMWFNNTRNQEVFEVRILIEIFFSVKEDRRTRGHGVKLAKEQCGLDTRKFSFSQGTVYLLNRLLGDYIDASSVICSKQIVYLRRTEYN